MKLKIYSISIVFASTIFVNIECSLVEKHGCLAVSEAWKPCEHGYCNEAKLIQVQLDEQSNPKPLSKEDLESVVYQLNCFVRCQNPRLWNPNIPNLKEIIYDPNHNLSLEGWLPDVKLNLVGQALLFKKMLALDTLCSAGLIDLKGPVCSKDSLSAYARMTPLFFALTIRDGAEGVDLLLHHKAEVNERDQEEKTPLMIAANIPNNKRVINVLLAHKADALAKTSFGWNARRFAFSLMHNEAVENILREAEATAKKELACKVTEA